LKTVKDALEEKAAQNVALEKTIEALKSDMSILKQEKQYIVDLTMELCEAADKLKYFLSSREVMKRGSIRGGGSTGEG
jgi:predicted RNA-binding protein with EMAP domain